MNIKKILSLSLSGLLFANSFCMTPYAIDNNNNTVPPAPKSANALDIIKNNPKASAGIAGGSLLAAGVLGAVGYLIYKYATDVPQDYLYKKLTEPISPVTADNWFDHLGGTQQDIDSYKQLVNDYNAGTIVSPIYPTIHGNETAFESIEKDVDRYPFCVIPGAQAQSDDLKNIFNRILKIYYAEHADVRYTQGWDHTAYMIYYKFMNDRNSQASLNLEDEAKVYFVYSKFIKMLNNKFGNDNLWKKQAVDYHQQSGVTISQNDLKFTAINLIFSHGVLTAGANLFLSAQLPQKIINIWDCIIMDATFVSPLTYNFNTDLILDQLNKTICSMLCERGRDGDALRNEISGDSLQLTCLERTLTLQY